MLRHWRGTMELLGLIAVLTTAARAVEDDEIPLAKVPAVVRQAASKALPNAKWAKAFKSIVEDETVYELVGADAKGREVEIELTPAGKVLEIETGVPLADVPRLVLDVLKAKDIKVDRARVVTQEGKVVAYTFEGKNAKSRAVEIRISADGKAVVVEPDEESPRPAAPVAR